MLSMPACRYRSVDCWRHSSDDGRGERNPGLPVTVREPSTGSGTIASSGLPDWKMDARPQRSLAHWLGEIYDGKKLREPINVVLVDTRAVSVEDAKARVVEASAKAGYTIRMGHSTGYRALIAGEPHDQLPTGWDDAFSNHLFEVTNNHGRFSGRSNKVALTSL